MHSRAVLSVMSALVLSSVVAGSFVPAAAVTTSATPTAAAADASDVSAFTAAGDFCASTAMPIPEFGVASPYPSTINVSGVDVVSGVISLQLGLTHPRPLDLEVLLVGPTGANIVLMSGTGGLEPVTGADLTFADNAAGQIPQSDPLVSGSYRPTKRGVRNAMPGPAPVPSNATSLSTLAALSPNGGWSLYVFDDLGGNDGAVGSIDGWCLTITEASVTEVVSSPNPSRPGDPVTFTATVAFAGVPADAGTVTFSDGATVLATGVPLDGAGRASFKIGCSTSFRGRRRAPA